MIETVLQLPAPGSLSRRVLLTAGIIAVIVLGVLIANRLRERTESAEHTRILKGLLGVAVLLLGIVGSGLILVIWEFSLDQYVKKPILLGTRFALTVGLVVGIYVFTDVLKRIIVDITEDQAAISRHQTELVFRVTQVSLYGLVIVVVFGIWNVNLGGLLVGAGFLGIVVGLAARQTLGSLIAGFVLMFSRPFEIGDWIQIGDREGLVTEISIVNTRIQTFDGEYAMIPNDVVGSTEIINRTRKGRLRLSIEVGVDYDTDLDHAMEIATATMREIDEVLAVPQPSVVLTEFGNSAIGLELRCWIDNPTARREWRARTEVIRSIKQAFDEEGITIPFPQRTLSDRTGENQPYPMSVSPPDDPDSDR